MRAKATEREPTVQNAANLALSKKVALDFGDLTPCAGSTSLAKLFTQGRRLG